MSKQVEAVKKYIKLIESLTMNGAVADNLLHADYLQIELPNQLNKMGQQSDRVDSQRRLEVAKKILSSQTYELTNIIEHQQNVVIEAKWTGKMAVDVGALKSGQEMKASFCMIFEFKEEKIYRVRNYDCFEAF